MFITYIFALILQLLIVAIYLRSVVVKYFSNKQQFSRIYWKNFLLLITLYKLYILNWKKKYLVDMSSKFRILHRFHCFLQLPQRAQNTYIYEKYTREYCNELLLERSTTRNEYHFVEESTLLTVHSSSGTTCRDSSELEVMWS